MKCEITGCGRNDAIRVIWFTKGIGRQFGKLCGECRLELYSQVNPFVQRLDGWIRFLSPSCQCDDIQNFRHED